jgi:hypothetical protein
MTPTDIERRRARAEAEHLLEQIRTLLDLIDAGEIALDVGACLLDRASDRLSGLAINGFLVAA